MNKTFMVLLTYDEHFEPWRGKHVVDKVAAGLSVAPVVGDLAQLVLDHISVGVDHRVHVRVQAQ
jgi:hypothetical protein